MNFDLNNGSLLGNGGTAIFNSGIAGKVEGVSVEVKRKEATGPLSYSDYTLVITDANGTSLNNFFSYFKNNDNYDAAKNQANQGYLLSRILSIAHAIMPKDTVYPDVSGKSCNEIVDVLFRLINDNAEGKKANVFVTYGTKTKPSQFLGLRFFNFIEAVDTAKSRLSATGLDMMERLVADAPTSGSGEQGATSAGW